MQTIDEISIGRQGEMFTLTIYAYGPDPAMGATGPVQAIRNTFLIGLPDQFHAETIRTIGRWLGEEQHAEQVMAQRPVSEWPYNPDAFTHETRGDTHGS